MVSAMTTAEGATEKRKRAIGANPERNRAHNRSLVLNLLREHGQIGRAAMARHTRLTQQAVGNIIDELLLEGMVIETGRLRVGRGQPARQFALNPGGPVSLGVEIAAGHLAIVFQALTGAIRARSIVPLADTAPAPVIAALVAQIEKLKSEAGAPEIIGMGVVMPGPFEIEGISAVGPATLKGWAGLDPAALIADATGIGTVVYENDATAAAVFESLHGVGRGLRDFCHVYFGVGLGLGLIHDGRPLRGAFGNAGEIGQIAVPPRGGGAAAALEDRASVFALRDFLRETRGAPDDLDLLASLDPAEDPALQDWIARAADQLSPVLAILENIFDPETITLGGLMPRPIIEAMIDCLQPLPVTVSSRSARGLPRLMLAQTGPYTAALGAAAMPFMDQNTTATLRQ